MTDQITLPKSVTHSLINLTGLAGCILSVLSLVGSNLKPEIKVLACTLATALPIILLELIFLKVHKRPSTGLDYTTTRGRKFNFGRVGTKLLGLIFTFIVIAEVYWLLPEYRGSFYWPFQKVAIYALPVLLLAAIPYFLLIDRRMVDPYDGYWQMGSLCLGRFKNMDRQKIKEHWMGWTIKAFFLPLMFVFMMGNISWLTSHPAATQFENFPGTYFWWLNFGYYVDLAFATAGYLLTFRLMDAQIRSSHPFFFGWFVTLMCYMPFWSLFSDNYLHYETHAGWLDWLQGHPSVMVLWGSAIVGLTLLYAWATATFGIRFSNLTHRGILTNGPYRFTKHPAYIFKNTSWWLMSIPFVPMMGRAEALRDCLLLLGLNGIYFARAKMEEKHLSQDPTYVQYALWMDKHGMFRHLGRILPFLRYKAPAVKAPAL